MTPESKTPQADAARLEALHLIRDRVQIRPFDEHKEEDGSFKFVHRMDAITAVDKVADCARDLELKLATQTAAAQADKARLDWLEAQQGYNLVSDDGERWAVSTSGVQPVPEPEGFKEIVDMICIVEPEEWRTSIREAIDEALAKSKEAK